MTAARDDIRQQLVELCDDPEVDIETWGNRMAEPGILTEKRAETLVRLYAANQSRQQVADHFGTTKSNVDRLRIEGEQRLQDAQKTLDALSQLEFELQPEPTQQSFDITK